ncbi:MAG: M23 family metallopeptidase, partial [Chloroflexota bacterium]
QATAVDRLGAANTEITWWEGEAAALSGQVGSARSRALLASALLAQLQPTGDLLAAEVQAQFQALSSAGHPINVATIADGLMPITEPAPWPAVPPPVYVLPGGHMAASLLTGAPLLVDQQGLLDTHALDGIPEWTTPVSGPITTPYGDATPYQAAHWAIDLGTRLYAPVVAAADGVVEYAGLAASTNRLASYGLVVLIRHNERVTTLYAHLDDRAHGLAVSAGDAVQKGQVIGYVGLTGYSTGPHLHFEVRVDHRSIDPLLLVSP